MEVEVEVEARAVMAVDAKNTVVADAWDWFGTSYVNIRLVPFLKPKTKTQEWQPKHVSAVFCQNMFWLPKVLVTVLFPRIPPVATAKTCFGCHSFFLVTKTDSGSQLPTQKCNRTLVDSLFLN